MKFREWGGLHHERHFGIEINKRDRIGIDELDREHYPDLFVQNSAKARAQFALYRDILKKFPDLAAREQ